MFFKAIDDDDDSTRDLQHTLER